MRYILLIFGLFSIMSMGAETAHVKVGYEHERTIEGRINKDSYILLSGQQRSVFFNPVTLQMDIMSKDDAACQAYGQLASNLQKAGRNDEIPQRHTGTYVFKYFDKRNKTVYDDFSDQFVVYDEPFDAMVWKIVSDSTATILGYECVMARTDYHGRDWTVWFAPEIPLSDGPWKFSGLPGLILKANESTGTHSFIANGIEESHETLPVIPRDDWYYREDRIKFLQSYHRYLLDPVTDIVGGNLPANSKIYVNNVEMTISELREHTRKVLDSGYDFLETDYR